MIVAAGRVAELGALKLLSGSELGGGGVKSLDSTGVIAWNITLLTPPLEYEHSPVRIHVGW